MARSLTETASGGCTDRWAPPSRVRDLVKRRIDGLGPPRRAVVELLAVCQLVGLGELPSAFGLVVLDPWDVADHVGHDHAVGDVVRLDTRAAQLDEIVDRRGDEVTGRWLAETGGEVTGEDFSSKRVTHSSTNVSADVEPSSA
jgi:hypothetical protein